MALGNFQHLCDAFCNIVGVSTPTLAPDKHGALAMTVLLRGVEISFLETARLQGSEFFVLADWGPVPSDDAAHAWPALMDSNARAAGSACATFARQPSNGHAVMQRRFRVAELTPTALYEEVQAMVDAGLFWRDTGTVTIAPLAQFNRDASASVFTIDVDETTMNVHRLPGESSDAGLVEVCFGTFAPGTEADVVVAAMEANFALMSDERALAYGRADTGELLAFFRCPAAETPTPQIQAAARQVTRYTRGWLQRIVQNGGALAPGLGALA